MSPVKNRSGLEAASPYADAVYFGVSELNLRSNSKGITLDNLGDFMEACHEKSILGYLTVNSTLYNNDIEKAKRVIKTAKESDVDAIIVWDPATIEIAKNTGVDFFISTQANISNWKSAQFYKKMGAKRVILAREMTLDQIKEVKRKVDMEIESFVHGAMCLAISGRCILSGFYENASANRGSCNQICRRELKLCDDKGNILETDGKQYMSPKDICMIEYIPELIGAGIDSFKIEGRQRSNKYIRETAKYYKKAVDDYFSGDFSKIKAKKYKEELRKVYNRNFSTGFYFGEPGAEGISFFSGNAGTTKRLQVGKVNHFYNDSGVAIIELIHRGLKKGDKIIVEGETTYLEQEIISMEIDGEKIEKAEKSDQVGLKVDKRVRKNDKVYLLIG